MTPEALWAMGRIGGFAVSPDGKKIAYTVAYYSVPENKSNREVFVMNADGSDNRQITRTPYQENEVTWIKGGTKLAFLSNDNGSSQLYEMNPVLFVFSQFTVTFVCKNTLKKKRI